MEIKIIMEKLKDTEFISRIFKSKKRKELDFELKFQYFQALLESNNQAHKYMSYLVDMITSGKPFSRGYSKSIITNLTDYTYEITEFLTKMSNGKYPYLKERVFELEKIIGEFLKNKILCSEGWSCKTFDCEVCTKAVKLFSDVQYIYNLSEINASHLREVGSKMSSLGEIKNKLGIPVPNAFCISVKLFEEYISETSIRDMKNQIYDKLNFEDIQQVQQASHETQNLFLANPLPEHLERYILEAYDKAFEGKQNLKVAVRSSAVGEDSADYSFAGLHHTELNVSRENLIDACIEVLLSKYSPQSVIYRYISGLRDEDIPMSVGCMEMIDSVAGGVLYTKNFQKGEDEIIIQAVRGLGSLVVAGNVQPQQFILEHSPEGKIKKFSHGKQEYRSVVSLSDGVHKEKIQPETSVEPCLSDMHLKQLASYALTIEKYFGTPQDIEWAIDKDGKIYILQARPLWIRPKSSGIKAVTRDVEYFDSKYKPILTTGECASHGVASGKVVIVSNLNEIKNVSTGSIIVARRNLPEFTSLIHKAAAVITDTGSTTGHLSIIARELNVPILTNTNDGTEKLTDGEEITLFADEARVYSGRVTELVEMYEQNLSSKNAYFNSPMWRIWHKVSKFIFKLNLTDPNSPQFSPQHCKTIHDIIRFSHEIAMRQMFSMCESKGFDQTKTYSLKFNVPLEVFIIDLGGGLKENINSKWVEQKDILCETMLHLIKGMTTPGIKWSGHLPMDTKSYASLIFGNLVDINRSELAMGARNFALISDRYVNFFSRLGYHFSRLDAFAGDDIDTNYINFNFRGGAADVTRKSRRGVVVSKILEHYSFSIYRTDDNVIANIRKVPKERILFLMSELGRLMGAIRNTDVIMVNQKIMEDFIELFLSGDPAPAYTIFKNTA